MMVGYWAGAGNLEREFGKGQEILGLRQKSLHQREEIIGLRQKSLHQWEDYENRWKTHNFIGGGIRWCSDDVVQNF